MGQPLTAAHVLRRLAQLELRGLQYYEDMYAGSQLPWVRKLATLMIAAEKRHHARFLQYAREAEEETGERSNPVLGNVPLEVRRLLTVGVFATGRQTRDAMRYVGDVEAIQTAIRAEENLALLLTQLREYVSGNQRRYISRVIKEEWGHKDTLEKAMRLHARKLGIAVPDPRK